LNLFEAPGHFVNVIPVSGLANAMSHNPHLMIFREELINYAIALPHRADASQPGQCSGKRFALRVGMRICTKS
jgi:hypothetical protein